MNRPYDSRGRAPVRDGMMIEVLAVIVAVALAVTILSAVLVGGFTPPADGGMHGPVRTADPSGPNRLTPATP